VGSSILFSEVKRPAKPLLPVPSEPSDVSFERGSVGFYQKRLDGGRSQFFISLEAQPSLRGRMTLLGKVVKGLNLVESFLVGDRIKDFYPPK
jgi:cyclophilin family peptidyl-prolyl cis-trans isomerase